MALSAVLAFWAVAVLLIACPGADWAFTINAGLGRRSVAPAVCGLVLGYLAVTLLVAAGVGAVVAGNPGVLTGLTLVGGAYLAAHGARTVAHPAAPLIGDEGVAPRWHVLAKGIGVSGLNPKGLLVFLALLPQFTSTGYAWPIAIQMGLLGLAFAATCGVFYAGLGVFARTVLHARPTATRSVSRFSGAAMIVIGVVLVVERLLDR